MLFNFSCFTFIIIFQKIAVVAYYPQVDYLTWLGNKKKAFHIFKNISKLIFRSSRWRSKRSWPCHPREWSPKLEDFRCLQTRTQMQNNSSHSQVQSQMVSKFTSFSRNVIAEKIFLAFKPLIIKNSDYVCILVLFWFKTQFICILE